MSYEKLPHAIAVLILGYLDRKELMVRVAGVSRRFNRQVHDPALWRKLSIHTSKDKMNPF